MGYVPLLVALLGPPALVLLGKTLFGDRPGLGIDFALELVFIGLAVYILFVVTRVERKPLVWIGLRKPTAMTFVTAAVLILMGTYVMPIVTTPVMEALGTAERDAGVERLAALPLWYRMVLGVAGGDKLAGSKDPASIRRRRAVGRRPDPQVHGRTREPMNQHL